MTGLVISGSFAPDFSGLSPAPSAVARILEPATLRGFYTGSAKWCDVANGVEIEAFRTRATVAPLYDLAPVGEARATLVIDADLGLQVADFTGGAPYRHGYSAVERIVGCIYRSVSSAADQYLFAQDGLDVRIPASTTDLVVRFGGSVEQVIPTSHGVWHSLLVGVPGSSLRSWYDGVQVPDAAIGSDTRTASQLVFGADFALAHPWLGRMGDLLIHTAFVPIIDVTWIDEAWRAYQTNYRI